jgi:hypothetical protein
MANPLHVFRKYQYVFLVGFGIMLMFAFVVAPPLSDYLQSRAETAGGGNPVAVTWKGGELREVDLARLRTRHLLTTRFLESLVRRVEAVEAVTVNWQGEQVSLIKGLSYPWVGRGMNADNAPIYQIVVQGEVVEVPQTSVRLISPKVQLVSQASSEEELVQRLMLAEKAKELGVVISDAAIQDYLDNLCDVSETNRPDYSVLLRDATSGRLDTKQFNAQMAIELAAQRMLIMSQGGLYAAPPELLYECYNRLNRQVVAELLAVDVASLIGEVPQPTDQDTAALYEQGKSRFPFPLSPDPGFKRREKIAFGYFKGVFDEFLQREMDVIRPSITNEQIEKYYEDNKATEFKVPELPAAESAKTTDTPSGDQPSPEAGAPATTPVPGVPPAEGTSPEAKPETAPGEPAQESPAGGEPAKESPAESPAKTEPSAPPTPDSPAPADPGSGGQTDNPPTPQPSDGQPDGTGPNSLSPTSSGGTEVTLVSYQADPAKTEPGVTPPTGDVVAPGTPEAAKPGDTAAKPDSPVTYKPLDDKLREEIRDTLARRDARQPAQEKLEKAVDQARSLVERYAQQLSRSKLLSNTAPPAPLDFAAIAKDYNLVHQKTPLMDVLDISGIQQANPAEDDPPYYEFARATETLFGQQTGMVRRTLVDVAYNENIAIFVPRRLVDGILPQGGFPIPPEKLFIYWREEVVPEEVPPLTTVRDEVVKAWKMQNALPLARTKAEQLAKQAGEAGKPLSEVFVDNAANVIKSNPFSWMTRGALPGSMGAQPMLSPVTGTAGGQPVTISGAGQDFMQAVFDLDVGQVGVAVNQPQKFVYVVRVDSQEPTDEQRRAAFFAAGITPEVNYLVQMEQADIIRDWYTGLEKEYQVSWKRDPERNWNVE